MHIGSKILLTRDCDVVEIPSGNPTRLAQGTPVEVTQSLGGSHTVAASGRLYRIAGGDRDALGEQLGVGPEADRGESPPPATGSLEEAVWDALRTCFDPEIPVNIVDLGLVYHLQLESLPGGSAKACMKMTLTAPGCGMGRVIASDAQQKLLTVQGIQQAEVEIVWDPPWHPSMITPEGKRALGLD